MRVEFAPKNAFLIDAYFKRAINKQTYASNHSLYKAFEWNVAPSCPNEEFQFHMALRIQTLFWLQKNLRGNKCPEKVSVLKI